MSLGLAAAPDLRRDLLGASGDAERFGGLGEQGSDRGERQLSRLLGGSDRTKAWENNDSSLFGPWKMAWPALDDHEVRIPSR